MTCGWVDRRVVNYIVVTGDRVYATGYIIQIQPVASLPGDVVVGARGISAHPKASQQHWIAVVVGAIKR
jgi:hypothetical protein